jgi:hypothetical protein
MGNAQGSVLRDRTLAAFVRVIGEQTRRLQEAGFENLAEAAGQLMLRALRVKFEIDDGEGGERGNSGG